MLKIDKGIPIPTANMEKRGELLQTLYAMEVKDSCFTNASRNTINKKIQSVQGKTERRFTLAREAEGFRIWRTE